MNLGIDQTPVASADLGHIAQRAMLPRFTTSDDLTDTFALFFRDDVGKRLQSEEFLFRVSENLGEFLINERESPVADAVNSDDRFLDQRAV